MKYLIKIDRYAAWLLFICLLLYFISGFGLTKGIISADFATKMHLDWLSYIILVAFVCHTSFAIHLAFKRWRFWHASGKTILLLFYLIFISFFIWADKFYARKAPGADESVNLNTNTDVIINQEDNGEENDDEDNLIVNTDSGQNNNASGQVVINQNTNQNVIKTFTLTELARYNGQSGRPAYVAVDGLVYDVTSVFFSGTHFSHLAGRDLSAEFHGQHNKSSITKYPVVGQIIN
ncbi:MAG: cytochrome b5 domain-containing protein [Patescibacteria group bacterium]